MNLEKHELHGIDRGRLEAVIEPVVRMHGAELVDIEWKREQQGWVLRLFVEKAGSAEKNATTKDAAVSLELCADVSRDLSPALDVADLVPHAYHLEVSSPGVERPLRSEADLRRFAGEKAKVKVHESVGGQKVLRGVLGPPENGTITLKEGAATHVIALDNIASARLVFEFGPAPRPGKKDGGAPHKKKNV